MKKPASEESRCDAIVAQLYGSSAIIRFGRKGARTPNTEGVPDRLYICGSRLIFFEVKSAHDYLSPKQISFLSRILASDGIAGCGGSAELLVLLNAPKPYLAGHAQIERFKNRIGR